ncbi:hypothetical protein B0G84_5561 [Paraburkholderia sp. BL8N3]|nr:hypothetical protein [Paraburkholderia sp. BL8N3]TCK36551.1 hypothetical protein B0G84_5561 [Paraburkholderia sp. BL8N3]
MVEKHQWSHYADFYRESAYSVFRQEHRDVRGRTPFRMIEVEQTDHDFSDPDVPECVLAMPLSASAENRWSWDMGDGWRNDSAVPGRILVLPAGVESRWRVRGRRNLLLLTIPSSTLRRILGAAMPDDPTGALRPLAQCTWEDQLVQQLMLCLWHASLAGNATDRLLVDGAMTTLVSHVLQRAGIEERPARHITLAAWRLKRVHEFVDAHLHEEIDIVTLSEAAGLSVRHFTRAFREEVGVNAASLADGEAHREGDGTDPARRPAADADRAILRFRRAESLHAGLQAGHGRTPEAVAAVAQNSLTRADDTRKRECLHV